MSLSLPKLTKAFDMSSNEENEYWSQVSSGATIAMKQLAMTSKTTSMRKGAASFPGSRSLLPVYKNGVRNSPTNTSSQESNFGSRNVLPRISSGNKETADMNDRLFAGYITDLQDMRPSTVRIYLSANSEDTQRERAALFLKAVPKLEEFCDNLGLFFELIEPQTVADVGHSFSSDMRLQEIKNCQRLSLGPKFVILLGSKLGDPVFPREIQSNHFDLICAELQRMEKLDLLHMLTSSYFSINLNDSVIYCLQPEKLANFDHSLQSQCVDMLTHLLTESHGYQMYHSELEQDAATGLFSCREARKHAFCYVLKAHRDGDPQHGTANAQPVLKEDMERVNSIEEQIKQHLSASNMHEYYIDSWDSINGYLDRLCADFVEDMKLLINQAYNEQIKSVQSTSEEFALQQEVLCHAHKCVEKTRNFVGRRLILGKVQEYFSNPRQCSKPFVLYGNRSVGKSATMATICLSIREWFSADSVIVARFLGTSADSSDIVSTIRSITQQICVAYKLPLPDRNKHFDTLFTTLTKFRSTIEEVSKKFAATRPLFILLDGLDQLISQRECLRTLWAICNLPLNVHVVLATIPVISGVNLLNALVTLVTTQEATAEVSPFTDEETSLLIQKLMPAHHISTHTVDTIVASAKHNEQPLHMSLVLRALSSSSINSHPVVLQTCGSNTEELVTNILSELCKDYGQATIKAFVSYLTVFPNGVHEIELLSLLMANEDVMNEVQQLYAGKNVFKRSKFPTGLLAALRCHLSVFISEHYAFGQKLLMWEQKEYYSIIGKYCGVIFPGSDENEITESTTNKTLSLYENLAKLYGFSDGKFTDNLDSDQSTDNNVFRINNSHTLFAFRLPQFVKVFLPIKEPTRLCESVVFNLSWLVRILDQIGGYKALLDNVTLFIKLLEHIQTESELTSTEYVDCISELWAFVEFLQLSAKALKGSPVHSLAAEILGRLPATVSKFAFAKKLIHEAESWKNSHCLPVADKNVNELKPVLLPMWPCFMPLGMPLKFRTNGPSHIIGMLRGADRVVTFSRTDGIDVLSTSTGDRLVRFAINREQPIEQVLVGHISEFIVIGFYSHVKKSMNVGVWSTETGVELASASFEHQFELMALDERDKLLAIVTKTPQESENVRERKTQMQRCIMVIDVLTRNIKYTFPVGDMHPTGITKLLFVKKAQSPSAYKILTIGSKLSKDFAIWDLEAEEILSTLDDIDCFVDFAAIVAKTDEQVACLSTTAGVLLLVDLYQTVVKWRIDDNSLMQATDMLVASDGRHVLVATKDHGITVWSFESGAVTKSISIPSESAVLPVTKLAFDSSEQFVYAGVADGKIAVVCIGLGQVVHMLDGHTAPICSLLTLPTGFLVSSADNNTCCTWQMSTLLESFKKTLNVAVVSKWDGWWQFENNESNSAAVNQTSSLLENEIISTFCVTPSSDVIVTLSKLGVVRCWNASNGKILHELSSPYQICNIYLTHQGKYIIGHGAISQKPDCVMLKIWKSESGEEVTLPEGDAVIFTSCSLPSDEDKLLTIGPAPNLNNQAGLSLALWDLMEMKPVASLLCQILGEMNASNLNLIGFAQPPFDIIQNGLKKKTSGKLKSLSNKMYAILSYNPKADRTFFFTFTIDLQAEVDSIITMDQLDPVHLDQRNKSCSILLSGYKCLTGTVSGRLVIWDVVSHKIVGTFRDTSLVENVTTPRKMPQKSRIPSAERSAHSSAIVAVCNIGSDTVASATADGKIKLWHSTSMNLLKQLDCSNIQVTSLFAASRWPHLLFVGKQDGSLSLWNTEKGRLLGKFSYDAAIVNTVVHCATSRVFLHIRDSQPPIRVLTLFNYAHVK